MPDNDNNVMFKINREVGEIFQIVKSLSDSHKQHREETVNFMKSVNKIDMQHDRRIRRLERLAAIILFCVSVAAWLIPTALEAFAK